MIFYWIEICRNTEEYGICYCILIILQIEKNQLLTIIFFKILKI